jgi:hypothetical protein
MPCTASATARLSFEKVPDLHEEADAKEDDPGAMAEGALADWSEHVLGLYLDPSHHGAPVTPASVIPAVVGWTGSSAREMLHRGIT